MGLITYEAELTTAISPNRIFNAFILDCDNFVPKIMPQAIKSIEKLEGNGGSGTIKLVTFDEGAPVKSATHRIDEIDEANRTFKYSVIDGDALFGIFEFISYEIKIEDGPNGGSLCKTTSKYHTKNDEHGVTEEKIKGGKDEEDELFKACEAYLLEHPEEYN